MGVLTTLKRTAAMPLLIVFALLAAACAGSDATAVSATSDDGGPQSMEDIEFTSPIGEFLGFDFSNNDDMEVQFAEMEREAGRITAACMLEKGFEYTPADRASFTSFGPGGSDIPYFSDEWVDTYGFGITTQRFPQSSVGELAGYPDEDFGGPDDDFVDPNQAYLDTLSDGEREAYEEALWGTPPDFGPAGPSEDFEFEPSGCQNEAFEQAFSQGPGGNFEAFFEAFGDELEAMEERAMAHPDVIAFNDNVSECARDKGMTWVDENQLRERFEPRLNALQPNGFGPGSGDPFEAAGVNPEEMSERELEEFFRDLNRLPPDKIDDLAALQAEELALARVVVDCGGGPLNEQIMMGEIRVEFEQEFLDRNADALAEFEAAE